MLGTTVLIIEIQMRASFGDVRSIIQAVLSVSSRACSIFIRASAIMSMLPPNLYKGRPNASRSVARSQSNSSAFSAEPMERMQWWMRPGPRRPCEISKPRPGPRMMLSLGTRTFSSLTRMCPCGASNMLNTLRGRTIFTPGVSIGTRI